MHSTEAKFAEKPLSIFDSAEPGKPSRKPVVLDTNVVLAAVHFKDPAVQPLWTAVQRGRLQWIATKAMLDELRHVATRLAAPASPGAGLDATLRCAHLMVAPTALNPRLWCTDPADQMFIDLALSARASWLFSRDKALLKLARHAQGRGVRVARPDGWMPGPTDL